jgi:hypothetical protein
MADINSLWSLVKRALCSLTLLTMCFGCDLCFAQENAHCAGHPELSTYERIQFVSAYYGQREEVYSQFLSSKGCERLMLDSLGRFGGKIRYADEKAGYAVILLAKEKLFEALDIPGVADAFPSTEEDNYPAPYSASSREIELAPTLQISVPTPRVDTNLPKGGPYFAAEEIGLDTLWQQHPEADGRGVVAAVIDSGLDLLHPATLVARDTDGTLIPKIVDLVSATTPQEDKNWVQLGERIESENGTFETAGRRWTAPQAGVYRFGVFRRELLLGWAGLTTTRKLPLAVGVLWGEKSHRVWIDTNGDGSFKDEQALNDFGITHDIGWFGKKEGEEDNRISFGVKIDSDRHAIFVSLPDDGHGATVSGSLGANRLTGGLYNGAAPNAQLIDARGWIFKYLPIILQLAARKDVGVISLSAGFARVFHQGSREGMEDFQRHVAERMVEVYDKPMVCVCVATGLISVNDYVNAEMLRRNRQTLGPYEEAVHDFYYASRDWSLVNGVLAPSAQLNTQSRFSPVSSEFPDGKRHDYIDSQFGPPAPAGYYIGDNESPTIPVVAGVIADLIAEAKREHVRYSTTRLNQAVFASARMIPGIPVYQQGYGLIQAHGAWMQLAKMAAADDPASASLTSFEFAQIKHGLKKEVKGYYHEVAAPSDTVDSEILVTRRGGYVGGRLYSFALRGNDGTYRLLTKNAVLVQDRPAKIRFKARAASGFHVAFVELIDQKAGVAIQQIPLSLKVPDVPESVAAGVDEYKATIAPRRSEDRLIYLGEDIQAVRFLSRMPYQGRKERSLLKMPGFDSWLAKESGRPGGEPIDAIHHVGPMESIESLVANEEAGIQEVMWENRGLHAEYETPYDPPGPTVPITGSVTVTKYAVKIAQRSNQTLSITNKLAQIEGKIELYDATLKSEAVVGIGSHGSVELKRTLPAGLADWRVRVTTTAALEGPTDAFLLDCSGNNGCSVTAQEEISSSKTLSVAKPHAGTWRIVVRSRGQVLQPQSYQIHEALLESSATAAETTDAKHKSGDIWTVSLPKKESDAQYAAFRIAGAPGNEQEKNGLLIAMTPLDLDAP